MVPASSPEEAGTTSNQLPGCLHRFIRKRMEQSPSLGSARVVLWDPNGSNRFVVGGGNELKMYEWNHEVGPL